MASNLEIILQSLVQPASAQGVATGVLAAVDAPLLSGITSETTSTAINPGALWGTAKWGEFVWGGP